MSGSVDRSNSGMTARFIGSKASGSGEASASTIRVREEDH